MTGAYAGVAPMLATVASVMPGPAVGVALPFFNSIGCALPAFASVRKMSRLKVDVVCQ